MRPVAVVAVLIAAGCGGSSSESETDESDAATTVVAESADDDLFTESDASDSTGGGDDTNSTDGAPGDDRQATSVPEETVPGDGTTDGGGDGDESGSTGDGGGAAGGDDGGGGDGDGGGDDGSTAGDAATTTGGESATDGGNDGGGDESTATDGADTDGAATGSDTGGTDGGGLRAEDIDQAVLLDSDELVALGLGTEWDVDVVIEPASEDDGAPCDLGRILAFDQLYADAVDIDDGSEFEQVVIPGAGSVGVEIIRILPTCEEVVGDLGADGRTIELSVAGANSALGFAVSDDIGEQLLTWFAADLGVVAVLAFHAGDPAVEPVVRAAFEQLVADVAAGI